MQLHFGIFFLLQYGSNNGPTSCGCTNARAHRRSSRAMAPPGGQSVPLLGRAVRAQEEGTEEVAWAGPGQARERTLFCGK